MGTQKGRLFELAKMYHTYQVKKLKNSQCGKEKKKPVEAKGQHFDEGKSISLAYSLDMYPEVLYDSHERSTPVSQMSFWEDSRSEAFYVESFDAEETVDVSFRETSDQDDDERLNKIAKGFSAETNEEQYLEEDDERQKNIAKGFDVGEDGGQLVEEAEERLNKLVAGLSRKADEEDLEEDEDKLAEMEKKMDKMLEPDEESLSMEADQLKEAEKGKAPTAGEPHGGKKDAPAVPKRDGTTSYEVSDEEFAKDIGAILQGQKVYDAEQKKAVNRSGPTTPQDPLVKSPPVEDTLDPSKNEHKIFEKIAKSMTYANSYDLGSIALEERFEKMEQEIEKEEVNKILRSNPSIQDVNVIEEEKPLGHEAMGMGVDKYHPNVPLDNSNGGRLISKDKLQKGDLILTSSSGGVFDIMEGMQASDSVAGIYAGENKLLTKGDGGVLEEKPLQPHLANKGVMVVLRHQNISAEKAAAIVDSLSKLRIGPEKNQPENWLKINCPSIGLHPDVCNDAAAGDKNKCSAYAGKINLGTMGNDSFLCGESIINIFEKSQMGFVPLLGKEHNGSLKYFGHLKNKA